MEKNIAKNAENIRILIYGDSNTHGYRAEDGLRFGRHERWTGICQERLDKAAAAGICPKAVILNEGLNGRTTCHDEFGMEFRNGLSYIEPCIRTHLPLDLVCVMLGSNDLKSEFHQSSAEIASNAAKVLEKARWVVQSKYPDSKCQFLLMSPIEVGLQIISGPFGWDFEGPETVEKAKEFASLYCAEASKHSFLFFDAAQYAVPGKEDGLHLDAENHRKLGEAFAAWLLSNVTEL